uniref:Probable DNA-directed RNA polymerase n=1 Tax=Nicotiana tabacum TaxID=4097 RepID=A0A1S4C9T8_TOBAC|nr:PREDICTED: probable DNA-directed RNA polymerase [Nicotiana tabacum]
MPKFLAYLNIAEGCKVLREAYLSNEGDECRPYLYPALLKKFLTDIQRARYETFILDIASAYEGYEFYLLAFVDFRGRIYRAGVLHFHERDLARSLIVFSKSTFNDAKKANPSHTKEYDNKVYSMLYVSASFHYKTFDTYPATCKWYREQRFYSIDRIIEYAPTAKDPLQFLSKALIIERLDPRVSEWKLPITQDASASAYQIISYFLLDFEIVNYTNLIPTKGDNEPINNGYKEPIKNLGINDVYDFFVSEIKKSLIEEIQTFDDPHMIKTFVCPRFDRKIIKSLLMPLIYGKAAYTMADDLYKQYSGLIRKKECLTLSTHIEKFFKSRFPHIVNLMTLIRSVGWLASAMGRPIYYSTPCFTTVQDYMKSEAIKIWIYDRPSKKRRQVTLRDLS